MSHRATQVSRVTRAVVIVAAMGSVGLVACSSSGGSDQLERIDGPAQVDPDFGGVDGGTNDSESGG